MSETRSVEELLSSLTNYERGRPTRRRWSLDGVSRFVSEDRRGKAVQVGGSKGKGTTVLYLESLARAIGLKTGAFMSPHLERVTERVRIDGREVDEDALYDVLQGLLGEADGLGAPLSYFEVITLAAQRIFDATQVDLAIYEVGLGGRYDSTTAIPVDASILTMVELEHTQLLGDTVASIAREKAFVIRKDGLAFTGAVEPALTVFRERAQEVGARLLTLPGELGFVVESVEGADLRGSLTFGSESVDFALPDASRFELSALTLAWGCLTQLWPDRTPPMLPVPRPALPGRFELAEVADGGVLVLDGSHTAGSWELVAAEIERRLLRRSVGAQELVALFGVASDKDWRSGLKPLLRVVDRWFVTGIPGTASEEPTRIVSWLTDKGVRAESVADPREGFERLMSATAGTRLVTGSFYLAGAVRSLFLDRAT